MLKILTKKGKEDKRAPSNTNISEIESINATLKLLIEESIIEKFEVVLVRTKQYYMPYMLFVIAKGMFNPAMFADKVGLAISGFLDSINAPVSLNNCEIYLDLLQLMGTRSPHLYNWKLNGDRSLVEVDNNKISQEVRDAWRNYYNNNWSILMDSMLTNADKADLAALAIAHACHDKYTADKVVDKFRLKIYEYLNSPMRVGDKITARYDGMDTSLKKN